MNRLQKKPSPLRKGLQNDELQYYFLNFFNTHFKSVDNKKLTTAPTQASTTVRTRSTGCKLGTILKQVPPAVPTITELLICIVVLIRD